MPIVDMKAMLAHAYANGYAVGAFDAVSLDFITAIVKAAEAQRAPVILSVAESHFDYFDFELLMVAMETAAKRASVPVAIHMDHAASLDTAVRSIRLGCNGVMVDASHLAFADNAARTRTVVEMAKGCGIPVEGELGYVPGVEGEDAERHPGEIAYTAVSEAKTFVDATGVDFLAVSVGTVHGRMKGEPKLDYERLKDINAAVNIPLVLHGGTGLGDAQYARLIENGIAKINYYTALAEAAGARVAENSAQGKANYTGQMKGAANAIQAEAERCIRLWGSAGQADQILKIAKPWNPVEHVIVYNTKAEDPATVQAMMDEGAQVLSKIPGVRRVVTGHAIQKDARYRHTWLVTFCHEAVIDSYKHHPDHVAFADTHFRPIAGDRITTDYQS